MQRKSQGTDGFGSPECPLYPLWDRPPPRKKEGLGIESIPRSGELDERCVVASYFCVAATVFFVRLMLVFDNNCSGTLDHHKERDLISW
jgi:hypothetical protein